MKTSIASRMSLAGLIGMALVGAACAVQADTAQNLILNGDFESNLLSPWTVVPYSQIAPTAPTPTTNPGWGNYALQLRRDSNTSANPPGVRQNISLGAVTADAFVMSFDYENTGGSKLVFRIRSGSSYYNADSGEWETATFTDPDKFFQRNWNNDASTSSLFNNYAANTALLTQTGIHSYELEFSALSGATGYTIEFFNTVTNSSVFIDNISLSPAPIPEPATTALIGVLLAGAVAGSRQIARRRKNR